MTFKEIVAGLGEALGLELAVEDDATAVRLGHAHGAGVDVVLQGFDERGGMLLTADLGEPPPERLERLFKAMLEANDLFRDTGGATLSIDPATGRVRLQRFDAYEAFAEAGAVVLGFFAQCAAAWAGIVRDFRAGGNDEFPTNNSSFVTRHSTTVTFPLFACSEGVVAKFMCGRSRQARPSQNRKEKENASTGWNERRCAEGGAGGGTRRRGTAPTSKTSTSPSRISRGCRPENTTPETS